jgi:very-short-patch-repair endonuclease
MKSENRVEEFAAELSQTLARRVSETFTENILGAVDGFRSPIEQLMGLALQYALHSDEWFGGYGYDTKFYRLDEAIPRDTAGAILPPRADGRGAIHIWPQAAVGRYRADFIVQLLDCKHWPHRHGANPFIYGFAEAAIECDGHDHHNLTKEQAEHDRTRDRDFQDRGILILRYPGSEIFKSPMKCAADALSILYRRARAEGARQIREST